jgi:hypothetical protein
MGFKLKKWLGLEDPQEVTAIPLARRTKRIGMDKNFRVGKIMFISKRQYMLIDVIEMCNEDDGNAIVPRSYNLWIYIDDKWKSNVTNDLIGQWVAVGFYMQSFRDKDKLDSYTTVLTCRFLNKIDNEQAARMLAIDLMDSRQFVNHPNLKLSNIKPI